MSVAERAFRSPLLLREIALLVSLLESTLENWVIGGLREVAVETRGFRVQRELVSGSRSRRKKAAT